MSVVARELRIKLEEVERERAHLRLDRDEERTLRMAAEAEVTRLQDVLKRVRDRVVAAWPPSPDCECEFCKVAREVQAALDREEV